MFLFLQYITLSQGMPQFSVGRPVDRVEGRPTRSKPKTATAVQCLLCRLMYALFGST